MLKAVKLLKGKDGEEELMEEVRKFLKKATPIVLHNLSYHLTRFCA